MKTMGKSFIEIGFSSRRNSGNRSSRLLKRSIDSHPNDCNAIASFYGVTGKKLQNQYKDFLSDFKIWNQKLHAKDWLIFPET
jgi:hypothetical protein